MLDNEREAEQISQFLLSEQSFDDQRHTPGELNHFRYHPTLSLQQEQYHYWYIRNPAGDMIGVLSGFENEQGTGGYVLDYIVVHKDYRHQGIATQLVQYLIQYVKSANARYILTYTCDLELYAPIQYLFTQVGFQRIGYYPDYYYDGEGRITFYYKM
ncbi:MAG: GNAT family N-acetyltransferase [Paenibacillaceae bacterium]